MILAQSPFWDFAKWDSGGTPDKKAVYVQRRILLLSLNHGFYKNIPATSPEREQQERKNLSKLILSAQPILKKLFWGY